MEWIESSSIKSDESLGNGPGDKKNQVTRVHLEFGWDHPQVLGGCMRQWRGKSTLGEINCHSLRRLRAAAPTTTALVAITYLRGKRCNAEGECRPHPCLVLLRWFCTCWHSCWWLLHKRPGSVRPCLVQDSRDAEGEEGPEATALAQHWPSAPLGQQ